MVIQMKLRIRDIREDRDFTQKQIADYLFCTQTSYSKYELGERKIPIRIIIKLAQFYHVSVDYLAGLTNVKKPYPSE